MTARDEVRKIDRDGRIVSIAESIVNATVRIREARRRINWRECGEIDDSDYPNGQCDPCVFFADATPEGPDPDPNHWCATCQANKVAHDEAKAWRAKRQGLLRRLETTVARIAAKEGM